MPEKITTKRAATLHTPEQKDYRDHCLFDRRTGQKKEKYIQDQKPWGIQFIQIVQGQINIGHSLSVSLVNLPSYHILNCRSMYLHAHP